jgi:hypothetical protein
MHSEVALGDAAFIADKAMTRVVPLRAAFSINVAESCIGCGEPTPAELPSFPNARAPARTHGRDSQ